MRFIRMAHSIPEAQALAIDTPYGLLLHTGDWKMDPQPLVGPPTDEAALAELGQRGVLAMICDSTNAMVEGHSGSEQEVRQSLAALIRDLRGRVAVTCFASNVARVETVAHAARDAGRSVAVVGRSLRNMDAAARECGYLRGIPPFLGEDDIADVPDDQHPDPDHRQPGRAAQRPGPRRDGHPPARRPGRGRHGVVLLARHPRQRARDRHGAGQPGAARREPDDRRGPPGACLRPSGAGRVAPAVPAGEAPLQRAGAWRVAPSLRPRRPGAGGRRHARC